MEPEFSACDGKQWALVEEHRELLKEQACKCPDEGWVNPDYDGTGVPRIHTMCEKCEKHESLRELRDACESE